MCDAAVATRKWFMYSGMASRGRVRCVFFAALEREGQEAREEKREGKEAREEAADLSEAIKVR